MPKKVIFWDETKCPVCGRNFIIRNKQDYVYKINSPKTKYFCSWGCLRKYEKEHIKPKKLEAEAEF